MVCFLVPYPAAVPLRRTAMRISPTIICISIWIAFGLALATGAMAQAGDKDGIVVILRPGLEKGQIETALDAARGTGRPVTVRWEDSAPVATSAPGCRAVARLVGGLRGRPRAPPAGTDAPSR